MTSSGLPQSISVVVGKKLGRGLRLHFTIWLMCGVAGGVPIVMKELLAAGMIHGDCMTCK
jgi:hypothetical protein